MGIETKTTYVCDRCYTESDNKLFLNGNEEGMGALKLKGGRGCKDAMGNWGGSNFDIDMLLCFECCDELIKFLRSCKKRG